MAGHDIIDAWVHRVEFARTVGEVLGQVSVSDEGGLAQLSTYMPDWTNPSLDVFNDERDSGRLEPTWQHPGAAPELRKFLLGRFQDPDYVVPTSTTTVAHQLYSDDSDAVLAHAVECATVAATDDKEHAAAQAESDAFRVVFQRPGAVFLLLVGHTSHGNQWFTLFRGAVPRLFTGSTLRSQYEKFMRLFFKGGVGTTASTSLVGGAVKELRDMLIDSYPMDNWDILAHKRTLDVMPSAVSLRCSWGTTTLSIGPAVDGVDAIGLDHGDIELSPSMTTFRDTTLPSTTDEATFDEDCVQKLNEVHLDADVRNDRVKVISQGGDRENIAALPANIFSASQWSAELSKCVTGCDSRPDFYRAWTTHNLVSGNEIAFPTMVGETKPAGTAGPLATIAQLASYMLCAARGQLLFRRAGDIEVFGRSACHKFLDYYRCTMVEHDERWTYCIRRVGEQIDLSTVHGRTDAARMEHAIAKRVFALEQHADFTALSRFLELASLSASAEEHRERLRDLGGCQWWAGVDSAMLLRWHAEDKHAGLRVGEMLRISDNSMVFRGTLHDEPVILKMYTDEPTTLIEVQRRLKAVDDLVVDRFRIPYAHVVIMRYIEHVPDLHMLSEDARRHVRARVESMVDEMLREHNIAFIDIHEGNVLASEDGSSVHLCDFDDVCLVDRVDEREAKSARAAVAKNLRLFKFRLGV